MKRTIVAFSIVAALMLALTGCQKGNTPEQEAVLQLISRSSGEVKGAFFASFEKVDSTTLSQEFDRRFALFNSKINIEQRQIKEYEEKNMPKNAAKHLESIKETKMILEDLGLLREMLEDSADSIIYTTYKFSCKGKFVDGSSFECKDMYVNITPDGEACNMKSDDSYHSGMGSAIPGYLELFGKGTISPE